MIGERLKSLRKNKRVNQENLAKAINVQKSAISHYETGKNDPNDMVKIKLAKYFNISLDYLIGVIDEPVPHYNSNAFVKLPDNISLEEKNLVVTFVDYVEYKRNI